MAKAARAWAKERGDYESFVGAAYVYVMARRKTTELVKPHVRQGQYGREGDNDVTFLSDFGFTKKQWNRRTQELKVTEDEITAYFDECIALGWEPTLFGLWKFKNGAHVSYNTGENEWHTPLEYILAATNVMGRIDLDPASSEKANQTVKASRFYDKQSDGLSKVWAGKVWLNPPYAGELIGKFISKFAKHVSHSDISEGIVLVNNATETNWFKELISASSAVVFPGGRVRFLDPYGNPGTPLQGQAVVYAGPNAEKFLAEFGKFGWSAYVQSR